MTSIMAPADTLTLTHSDAAPSNGMRPGASDTARGPGKTSTATPGSGSTARTALGRQKSGGDRVEKRPGGTAAAAAGAPTKANAPSAASISGAHEVTSTALQSGWPDITADMRLRVAPSSDVPGVYIASFDFGVFEGFMLVGTDQDAIRARSRALDGAPRRRYRRGFYQGPNPYLLNWRGFETGEGEVDGGDHWVCCEMEVSFVSDLTDIRGTKVSDEVPSVDMDEWMEYHM
ncbi:hypothetical protein MAPG_07264 [Magnaporthiopsis poae ATCC 64411]|uniref:Uncharacterized protein n=1 Tax=Magnaporthiopsis poae (strain ATCC 64411 / 73-15) TaxID=644358 RepID=A0A0C4E475_MAGP6|nr:hypothetical protein MAPG_07264 [Magnaporthiopsis poae ATCC 64411]